MKLTIDRRQLMLGAGAVAGVSWWMPKGALAQQTGETLRIRMPEEVTVLDPAFRYGESELWVTDSIFPKLVMFKSGSTWEWELYSAESIEQIDPSKVAFTLKQGLMWSGDFGEVTAEDVKFSFERFKDPALAAPNAPLWGPLDHVEVTGKYSGIIHLTEPYAGLFGYVLPHDGGQIVCKRAVEAAGGRFGAEVPATSGPYRIVSIQAGQGVVLEADPNWPGPAPAFTRVEMLPITDSKAAENAILSGDLAWGIISNSTVPMMQEQVPAQLAMDIRPTPNFVLLGANMAHPQLADANVRRAIQLAVDRAAILEGAYFGIAEPSYGLAAKGLPGYVATPQFERNVEEALMLIEAAGASGMTLELEVPAETDKITAAQIIQANLAEIGLSVNINQHEAGAFWSLPSVLGKDQMQLFLSEWIVVPPDMNWITQWLLPEQAGIWNWQYFEDADFARLHRESSAELDLEKRNALLLEAQARLDASYSTFILTHTPRATLYNKKQIVPAMKPNAAIRLEEFAKA